MGLSVELRDSRLATKPVTIGGAGGEAPLENYSLLLEKCVGHSLKILDIVQKNWARLRKLIAPAGVPSWLRACLHRYACAKHFDQNIIFKHCL